MDDGDDSQLGRLQRASEVFSLDTVIWRISYFGWYVNEPPVSHLMVYLARDTTLERYHVAGLHVAECLQHLYGRYSSTVLVLFTYLFLSSHFRMNRTKIFRSLFLFDYQWSLDICRTRLKFWLIKKCFHYRTRQIIVPSVCPYSPDWGWDCRRTARIRVGRSFAARKSSRVASPSVNCSRWMKRTICSWISEAHSLENTHMLSEKCTVSGGECSCIE